MKHKKLKTPVIYYVFAGILLLILAFAGYQALKIYLPQSEESKGFESIKEEAGVKDIDAKDIIDESGSSKSGDPADKSTDPAGNKSKFGKASLPHRLGSMPESMTK